MAIDNLTRALLIGCVLVVLILIAFLFEWRTAFISLVSIPLSLTAAALVLHLRGETMNVMVLAGLVIAVGVVVDDAIIDIENTWRRLRRERQEPTGASFAHVILEASLEVRTPIVYATLINVVAIVPVFFLEGLSGAFFQPLALAYALAVLASMVVALTVTPALALILLRGAPLHRRDAPLVRWLKRGYAAALGRVIVRPAAAFVGAGALAVSGLAVTPLLGQSLLPDFKERDFLMHWLTKPGTSLPEETRISVQACRELRQIPGVRNCGSHIGQALFADEVVDVYFGENWVSVAPEADYDATLASIQEAVEGYPGLFRDVQTYLKERIREVLTGASQALVVRISGDDLEVLRRTADEVQAELDGTDGLVDLHTELQEDVPHVEVTTKLAEAGRVGLKSGRRASGRRRTGAGHRGERHLAADASLRREHLEHARGAREPHQHSRAARRHAERGARGAGTGRRHQGRSDAQRHPARERDASHRRERRRERPRPGLGRRGRRAPSCGRRAPARLRGGGSRGVGRARRGAGPPPPVRARRRGRDLRAPAGGVRELAPGDSLLPHPAARARGGCARGLRDRWDDLARVARRVPDRVRHRRAQRDPADQPLPAPGAVRGRAVRSGAGRCAERSSASRRSS